MSNQQHQYLVTTALVYANGDLHLGHMLEQIQADIWVRATRCQNRKCDFISGNDAHGTPIMLKAAGLNMSPEDLIATYHRQHHQDCVDFHVHFDHFGHTHSQENIETTYAVFEHLQQAGLITTKVIEQAYDPEKKCFLADRYIKGGCPHCQAKDQYGDHCESCGGTYKPDALIEPYSVLSGATPIQKHTTHYFFKLGMQQDTLESRLAKMQLQPAVRNKLKEWFAAGLKDWDISRDAPYFGILIPGHQDQYFYVWMDAPIGYISIFKQLCAKRKAPFEAVWGLKSQYELVHFIGKDIIYFHGLFWPAMLEGLYRPPSSIHAHGFLTIQGHKMSKSKGHFVTARDYLDRLPPEYLRYYFASKLNDGIQDLDLNWEELMHKVNADLIGKVINIASRCAKLLQPFEGQLATQMVYQDQWAQWEAQRIEIAAAYTACQFSKAMEQVMHIADQINQLIAKEAPWALMKSTDSNQILRAQQVCTMGINGFYLLMNFLQPVLPDLVAQAQSFLHVPTLPTWDAEFVPLLDHRIAPYQPLLNRMTLDQIKPFLPDDSTEKK